jgi:hypothetical protein
MTHGRAIAVLGALGLYACGGSGGGGGGGTPLTFSNFQPADAILGQSLPSGGGQNNGAGPLAPNQVGLFRPSGHVGDGSVYVGDTGNNRILGWSGSPAGLGASADFVLGQADFTTVTAGTSATKVNNPFSCWVASGALFVADANNHRVLIYGGPPASNVAALVALGKPDLTTSGPTAGQAGLAMCTDVCVAAGRVVVADTSHHRVMIWNGIPAASGANADLVVGQPDFASNSLGTSASKLRFPSGVWTDGTRLAVADKINHRVLIWTTFPTSNGQAADVVVGQPDFLTDTSGNGPQKMNEPWSVASDGVNLFVADAGNNRVLVFSPFPTSSNPAATGVLGQSNFVNVAINDDDQNGSTGPTTSRTMRGPQGVTAIGNRLYVADTGNSRILVFTGS